MAWRNRGSVGTDKGAALVEMALVLPLLMMILIGVFATARAWQVHNVMDHAAREAARHGATLDPFDPDVAEAIAIAEMTAASVPTDTLVWCVEQGATPCGYTEIAGTEQVAVEIELPDYRLDFVFFSLTIDMEAKAFARYES